MHLLIALVGIASPVPASAATISDAAALYSRNKVGEAEQAYAAIAADPAASSDDRNDAQRELARITWLIDGNAARALDLLAGAERGGRKPCDTANLTARVLDEAAMDEAALRRGPALLGSCPDPSKRDAIRVRLIHARLDLATERITDRRRLIAEARSEIRLLTPDAGVDGARTRLEAALLDDRAQDALAAWRDFFWLDEGDAPQALAGEHVLTKFQRGLGGSASVADRVALADLLMRTGFAEESQRFAMSHGLARSAASNPIWRRLQAYWSARQAFEVVMLRVNRRFARLGKTEAVLKDGRADIEAADRVWRSSLIGAASGRGDPDTVLARDYGIVGTGVGETSGYPSIHRGHVVEDRHLKIEQYGKTARIHYISVDNMIANGFESWLWDGGPMVGGWQANGVIVNVRPGYVQSPLRAYQLTFDSTVRRERIARQAHLAAEDIENLRRRPVATLEGLNDRIQLQLVDRVAAVARAKSPAGAGQRQAFLAEYSRANFDQSILTHEGRHAIDESLGLSGKVEQPVLEYQAKLSELALASYPRMALRNLDLNLEGDGPHDRAGARIFEQFSKWMNEHKDEIAGYDGSLPLLVQLDKLTDSQIREIARSLDPLAQGKSSPAKL